MVPAWAQGHGGSQARPKLQPPRAAARQDGTGPLRQGPAPGKIDEDAYNQIVDDMLAVLGIYGLAEEIEVEGGRKGYRVPATVIEWRLGQDKAPDRANTFFLDLYHNGA